jgi:hypothetical protein
MMKAWQLGRDVSLAIDSAYNVARAMESTPPLIARPVLYQLRSLTSTLGLGSPTVDGAPRIRALRFGASRVGAPREYALFKALRKLVWETAPSALLLCHRCCARRAATVEEQVLSRRTLLLHMKWAVASADVRSCGVEGKTVRRQGVTKFASGRDACPRVPRRESELRAEPPTLTSFSRDVDNFSTLRPCMPFLFEY